MIIVTGGAGFIGSAVVWGLNRRGVDDIVIVDELGSTEKWKNLTGLRFQDYFEKDDFRSRIAAGDFSRTASAIIHMGACSSTTVTDASYLIDNNYRYTVELARFAVRHDIRFVYASSAATYGDGARGYDDTAPIDPLRPLNMYGYSKQLFDLWARNEGMQDRMVGLKFSNVFGPNEYHKDDMRSVPVKAYRQIVESGTVALFKSYRPDYADGEQMRDFVYIKDVVEMVLFALDDTGVSGIFNIGSGRARTWNDLARAVFAAMDVPVAIDYIEMPSALRDKYQYYTELPMAKFHDAGWRGQVMSLEDAIRDYVCEYLTVDARLDSDGALHRRHETGRNSTKFQPQE